jgi:hypothetical protein
MPLDAGQILNVFELDEINLILTVLEKLPDSKNRGPFQAYTNGFTPPDVVYQILNKNIFKKIENVLDRNLTVNCGVYLKEFNPWDIHTDFVHKFDQGTEPDLAVLIPLKIISKATIPTMTHTIIFNETCKTNFIDYCNTQNKLSNHARNIHDTHCSHCDIDTLEYVSLHGAYAWEPGSLIYWDRRLLHCSDNFLKNNIEMKQALVLFTSR